MHLVIKIFFLTCIFLFFAMKFVQTVRLHRAVKLKQQKKAISPILAGFDPRKDFDFNFIGLIFVFIIFFLFFGLSVFWVLSIEGVNLLGFWSFIFGFSIMLCSYFYIHRKGMLDL